MRRVMGMATAGLLVVMCGSAGAQVLTNVPDNAIVFVRVKNLQDASKKIGGLMQQWGIAAMQPALADPLAAMEGMGNIQQGLNRGGEAAMVFFNPATVAQNAAGEPYVIMLPVSDYQAFIGNFQGAQPAGDLTEITLPTDGSQAFVAKWGAFAAISPNRQLVAARPQASKATGLAGKQLADRDVTAYVNFNGFRNQAAGYLGFGRMMAVGQMDQNPNATAQQVKYMPLAKAAVNQMFNGFEHFINETQAMTLSLDLADDGVKMTMLTEFMPDSYLGKYASQWKSPQTNIGVGLPDAKYAMLGTFAMDSTTFVQLVDDVAAPIMAEAQKLGPDAKPVLDYFDAMKQQWKATKSQSFGVSPGQGKPGETPLFDMVVSMQGDSKAIMQSQERIAALQGDFTKMVQMQGQPTSSMQLTKNAKTVNGVSFDQMTMTFKDGAAAGKPNPNMQMMEMLYGKGGFTMLMAPVDANTIVATTARDDAALSNVVNAAKSGKSVVADQPETKQVAGQLPGNPIFSVYLYGDQFMGLVSRASQAFAGSPIQTQLPAGTPPLGLSMSTEGSAVRMDYYVPSPLVKSAMGAAMQEMMKKQQRQNQGGQL